MAVMVTLGLQKPQGCNISTLLQASTCLDWKYKRLMTLAQNFFIRRRQTQPHYPVIDFNQCAVTPAMFQEMVNDGSVDSVLG